MINILSFIIAASLEYNFSNFTSDGILRVAFDPFLSIFGNYTWGIVFGFIGAGLYANERSLGTISIYLILVGVFMSIILPVAFAAILGLILAFILGSVFYVSFIKERV